MRQVPLERDINKHRDSKSRFSELLPVSVAFQTSHTALEADCPGNSGTKQEVPFTKSTLESHSLLMNWSLLPLKYSVTQVSIET